MREEEVKKYVEVGSKENFHVRLREVMCWANSDGKLTCESFLGYYVANIM